MPHRHSPRRSKADRQLITLEQAEPANVIQANFDQGPRLRKGNLVRKMDSQGVLELEEMIQRRQDSAEELTNLVSKEIERSERQFKGLFAKTSKFHEQHEWDDPEEDDVRIFMRKTMEQIQIVYSHLDGLTGQLNPLLTMKPSVSGLYPPEEEFKRAKVKELLVNFYLDKNRFKKDILSRWRWNFLKHPSAYLRVLYRSDPVEPDIEIELVDRGMLYIDPYIMTGDIKDAAWVIERGVVTRDEAHQNIEDGHWHVPEGVGDVSNLFAPPQDETVRRLIGGNVGATDHRGPERDDLIEVLHYWQAERRGNPHAYGVLLGGKNGKLVRWGPNPFPYTGIPYRGKSYIRDPYKPDGTSLSMQYRSIQETFNTLFNLRIEDVLENVKQRWHVIASLFNDQTKGDHENNQKYVRLADDFAQQILTEGRKLSDFMIAPAGGDSTQHLLSDLQYLGGEGQQQTSTKDVFRGGNPQSGATLGQFQEQLMRSLGVFRPIFSQEMTLIEEVGQILDVYFSDEDFFGPERIVSIIGPNRYKDVIGGFTDGGLTGLGARKITPDEMDVDVTVEVLNQAEHMASRTLRLAQQDVFFESLRHHPELAKQAGEEINFPALFRKRLEDMGEDIEAITYTPEEKQKRAQEQKAEQEQAMMQEGQFAAILSQSEEQAKMIREIRVVQEKAKAESQRDSAKITTEHQADIAEILAKANADNRAAMVEMLQDHQQKMEAMLWGCAVEI